MLLVSILEKIEERKSFCNQPVRLNVNRLSWIKGKNHGFWFTRKRYIPDKKESCLIMVIFCIWTFNVLGPNMQLLN